MTKLTLQQIRKHDPCKDSWVKLLNHFGKDKADDTEVTFNQLIDVLGVGDAIWCLRCLPEDRKQDILNFAADCADRVSHIFEEKYADGDRPRKAIEVARDTSITLNIARAAYAASTDTASAAAYAAYIANVLYANISTRVASCATKNREKEQAAQADLLLKYFGDE